MPSRPPRPCNHAGCSATTRARYCDIHAAHYAAVNAQRERARPSAAQRGYDSVWRSVRADHIRLYPYCQACGDRKGIDVDHITPLSQGGTHHFTNLQTLCIPCHRSKTRTEANAAMRVSA